MALASPIASTLPTLYEYYTSDGIKSGLNTDQSYFTLNEKNITLYSGAMHYFRIPKEHWRDRLKKLRATGLNTVETYVPWNLHEFENGTYDFGNGGSDYQSLLDVEEYLKIAQEEDLFAIVRAGPYICAEWEWGGFPSWLQREEGLKVRTSDSKFMKYVTRFFNTLLPILAALQFTKGGPIIAFQVENEYGNAPTHDLDYIAQLVQIFKDNNLVELLVSADNAKTGTVGTLPDLLMLTVNSGDPVSVFDTLKDLQPNRPLMAMEFYPGWFDYWGEKHSTLNLKTFRERYEGILSYPASVNLYMFHGGTSFGFTSGASSGSGDNSGFKPITSSYDYNAPLTEAGDYTDKYYLIKELIEQYNLIKTLTPEPPEVLNRTAYPSVAVEGVLDYEDLIERAPALLLSDSIIPMEQLFINNASGQSYGYITYRKDKIDIPANSVLKITGHIRDSMVILVNNKLISKPPSGSTDLTGFGFWNLAESEITLSSTDLSDATLDIIIENWGRGDSGHMYTQYKGLGPDNQVLLNNKEIDSWTIYPYEFKKWWTSNLEGWKSFDENSLTTRPALYRATLTLEEEPSDNFINMEHWTMGVVVVNGFVLGRYSFMGPQQTLYLPGPWLKKGVNEIIVFEEFNAATTIEFSANTVFNLV